MRLNQPIRAFVACVIAILPAAVLGQNVVYVDADATGANDGTSWQNAFTDLQDGIPHATAGMQIWVAEGTYRPAGPGGDRTASFVLRPGVGIYGGFLGNESSVEERPSPLALTTLSGDLLGNDGDEVSLDDPTRAENSFHVVTCSRSDSKMASLLDGTIVASGNANGTAIDRTTLGGGLYCVDRTLHLTNDAFVQNAAEFGGAVSLGGGQATITQVRADSNYAKSEGGGLYVEYSDVVVDRMQLRANASGSTGAGVMVRGNLLKARRVIAVDNRAIFGGAVSVLNGTLWLVDSRLVGNDVIGFGAALYADASDVLVANSIVSGNEAGQEGGGIWTIDGELKAVNVTIAYNRALDSGGGVFAYHGIQRYENVILAGNRSSIGHQVWGNIHARGTIELTISTSLLEDGLNDFVTDGGGNVFEDPVFVDTLGVDLIPGSLDDSLALEDGSPGIDIGSNAALPPDSLDDDGDGDVTEPIPFDISGNPRIVDGGSGRLTVDAGAFENAKGTSSVDDPEFEIPRYVGVSIEVYPNPVSSDATVILHPGSTSEHGQLVLYDIQGRFVAQLYTGPVQPGHDVRLTTPHQLAPGFYSLVFEGTISSCIDKIIVFR